MRDSLGLPAAFDWMTSARKGLILVTGGKGSGKTTSLNYLIEQFRAAGRSPKVKPDLQTPEELLSAIELAETGDLVLADYAVEGGACHAVWKMAESHRSGLEFRERLAPVVETIFSQKLIRRSSPTAAVVEVLFGTPLIRSALAGCHSAYQVRTHVAEGFDIGMQTFDQCILEYWKSGRLSSIDAIKADLPHSDVKRKIEQAEGVNTRVQVIESLLIDVETMRRDSRAPLMMRLGFLFLRGGELDPAKEHFEQAFALLEGTALASSLMAAARGLLRPSPELALEYAKRALPHGACPKECQSMVDWSCP